MATRDEIVKQNLEFVYGKRTNDVLDDPDKVSYRPTKAKYVDPDAITNFGGEFEFLAPTFACKVYLPEESTPYPSFQHALLASKFKNDDKRQEVRTLLQIKDVKRLVSKEKGKNSVLFADWAERCIQIAEMLLLDKFIRNKKLKEQLMKTGRRTLIFKNDFGDLFWGVDETQKGQNQLGKLLEKVRMVIDAGEEVDTWIRHQVKLIEPEKVSLMVNVAKEGVKVDEDCKTIELKSKFFVGKSEDMCDIVAAHPTVSRVHAMLVVERSQGLLQVIDLGSANGTKLNNSPLSPFEIATLDASSVLSFGASARQYSFVVDTTADVKRKQMLLDKIASEQKNAASTYGGTSVSAEETAINTVFVGNISFDATEADIKSFFAPCGVVLQMNVPKDRASGAHKGIAFVTFADFKGVMQALARDGDELVGRNVKVKKSDAKKPATGAGGAGGREGGRGGDRGGGERNGREERDHRTQEEKNSQRNNGDRGGRDNGRDGAREGDRGDNSGKYGLQSGRNGDRSPPRHEARAERAGERRGDSRERGEGRRRDDRGADRRGDARDRRADSRDRDRRSARDSSRDRRDGGRDARREQDSHRDRKRARSDSRDRRSPPRGRRQSPSPRRDRSKSRSPPRRVARVEHNDTSDRTGKSDKDRRARSPSPSPVRRKPVDASPSPPRRGRSPSPSPPRRGRVASPTESPSPPRRARQPSVSPSPPRRRADASPARAPGGAGRGSSPSPPRRPRAASPAASPSPPRRTRAPSASPPRRPRQPSLSPSSAPSPPRKARAAPSPSASPSPPRRGQRSPSPSPPRKSRFN